MPTNEELAAMGPGAVRQLIDTLQKRAEAAEKRLELRELACDEAIAEERRHWDAAEKGLRERAEAAERHLADEHLAAMHAQSERDAALASKAQLAREVSGYAELLPRPYSEHLAAILDRHASDAEHPDTVRLRELIKEVKHAMARAALGAVLAKYER